MIELKEFLRPEPSDDTVLTALDALLEEEKVKGVFRRGQGRKLKIAAKIQITPKGRESLHGLITINPAVVHGDQINNYGHAGSIGRDSHGVINSNVYWKDLAGQTDLHSLAEELKKLRVELRKLAVSREDDKQVALIADAEDEAERGNGDSAMRLLSGVQNTAYEVAKDIGTDLLAKIIAKVTGIEP